MLVVTVSCSGGAPSGDGEAGQPDMRTDPASWASCGDVVECTTVTVPLDWNDPNGGSIDLVVARRPATDGPPLGTVVVHPGGPGASGVDWLERTRSVDDLNRNLDVVSWDTRGVGRSTPLDCGDQGAPAGREVHELASTTQFSDAASDLAADCDDNSQGLASVLGTAQTADDLDAVRRHLGVDDIGFIGLSWGSYVGLTYAEAHGEHLRALVLDGVVDPGRSLETFLADQLVGLEAALDEVAPTSDGRDRFAAALDAGTDPAAVAFAAIASTYTPDRRARLAEALDAATEGDGSGVDELAAAYWSSVDYAAYVATLCADLEHPGTPDGLAAMRSRLVAAAPRLGPAVADEVAVCGVWPTVPGRRWMPSPTSTTAPVFIVSATGDPVTPPVWADAVAAALPGAVRIVDVGERHTSFGSSPCVRQLVVALLRDGATPSGPVTCPSPDVRAS